MFEITKELGSSPKDVKGFGKFDAAYDELTAIISKIKSTFS